MNIQFGFQNSCLTVKKNYPFFIYTFILCANIQESENTITQISGNYFNSDMFSYSSLPPLKESLITKQIK